MDGKINNEIMGIIKPKKSNNRTHVPNKLTEMFFHDNIMI